MIEINNLTSIRANERFLRKAAENVLRGEKVSRKTELSIALIRPGRIKEVNRRYRGKNRITDVLAFPSLAFDYGGEGRFLQKDLGLGEVVICPSEVKKNAKRFHSVFKKEVTKVLIHGILHLLGYDHEKSGREAKIMEETQSHYLLKILYLC